MHNVHICICICVPMYVYTYKNICVYAYGRGFPEGSAVKNLLPLQEMQVRSLGWDDPLEKEMATHLGILAWEIPWTEESGVL